MVDKVPIGIIGCGNISPAYFKGCRVFDILDLAPCADLDMGRAEARAAEFGIPNACTVEELLADPEIEIVVNLTIPKAHAEVDLAALEAGKHVYSEKPLAVNARGRAAGCSPRPGRKGVRVGCAPDTFLGGGIQTCRKLIDDGWIGEPVAATAFMTCHGHESWHPDPEFYYQVGGGPMLDMGPYYLTALVNLLGPVARVTGSTRITFPERLITSQPKYGKRVTVEAPTHVAGVLDFANGAIGTIITSFDVWAANLPRIEIYGTEGSLQRARPEHASAARCSVRRAGQPGVERRAADARLRREQPRHRRGRHGLRAALRPAAPRERRAGLPRARRDAGLRGCVGAGKHVASTRRARPLPLGLRHGELDARGVREPG